MISKTPDCEPWGQELFGELSAGSKRTLSMRPLLAQSGRKPGVTARLIRPRIGSNLVIAVANEVVHNGGHKTKAGLLTKPYFIGFLGFPESAAENPSLYARLAWDAKNQ